MGMPLRGALRSPIGDNMPLDLTGAVHDAHVATLAFEFCTVVTTAELLAALAA